MFRTTILTGMALCLTAAAPAFDEAEALATANKHAQARQAFLDFAAANPQSPDAPRARLLAANELFEARQYEAFREEAPRVLAESAAAPTAQRELIEFRIGRSWVWQHNWTEAWHAFDDFIANHPDSPMVGRARFEAAVCLHSATLHDEFLQAAERIQRERPDGIAPQQFERLSLLAAKVPYMQEQYGLAEKALRKHIDTYPESSTNYIAMLVRGHSLMELADEVETPESRAALKAEAMLQFAALREKMEQTPPSRILYYLPLKIARYSEDYARVLEESLKLIEAHKAGTLEWALGKLHYGIERLNRPPVDPAAAIEAFDAVLAADIEDDNLDDHVPTQAAFFRAMAARKVNDAAGLKTATEALDAMPESPLKFKYRNYLRETE